MTFKIGTPVAQGGDFSRLSVTNGISFHARVGRFSPFLYFEECGPSYTYGVWP